VKVIAIAAVGRNGVIGRGSELPWDIPEDMKFFRDSTRGQIVVMGRKTYDSLGKALPARRNAVITRNPDWAVSDAEVYQSTLFLCRFSMKFGSQRLTPSSKGMCFFLTTAVDDLRRPGLRGSGSANNPTRSPPFVIVFLCMAVSQKKPHDFNWVGVVEKKGMSIKFYR